MSDSEPVVKGEMVGDEIKEVVDKDIKVEVSTSVTTVVAEEDKEVKDELGLKMIKESNLSEDQKKLALKIYESVKSAVQSFISDASLNNTIKITKTIGQVIKQLENASLDGKVITGADKKVVAIELGRILIKEVTPDNKGEVEILMVYDLIAESTLEAMIEVSKVVNIAVEKMATKCCPGLLSIFKKAKATK
jgi:predicted component of viral defense system (DUF524 family)